MTRKLIAGIVLSAVGLLAARRVVATATTTTTLPPSATFSPATTACLKEAATQQKMCNMTSSVASCQTEFDTALASCFAPGKGVSCAAACAAKRTKCTAAAASTIDKQCTKSCQNSWVGAGAQCGSDQACLVTARVDYDACKAACNVVVLKCKSAFGACLTKCPDLGSSTTTTLAPLPKTTTTTVGTTTTTTTLKPSTTTLPSRSTTTTTTTSTTLPPAGYSAATAACIKQAAATQKACKATGTAATCQAQYDAAFARCFAPGKGVACAVGCVAKKTKCAGAVVPGANKSCTSGCQNNWINAGSQCSGVPSCYTAALAAFNACKLACAGGPVVSCQTAFTACIARCPNL